MPAMPTAVKVWENNAKLRRITMPKMKLNEINDELDKELGTT